MIKVKPSNLSKTLTQIDFAHLWHPFTQEKVWCELGEPLIIESAEGVELVAVTGERFLDGVSSLWCNVHGHGVEEIVSAIQKQAAKLCHSTLLGLSHQPILELTEKLLRVVPRNLSRAFYADSGTTAVEAGLRICLEWWQKSGTAAGKKKTKLASLVGAYHGDTLGSVGVGFSADFHKVLQSAVVKSRQISPPHVYRFFKGYTEDDAVAASVAELKNLFEKEGDSIAAFIIEPLVQGAAGIWVQPVEFLKEVAALCRKYNILLIADEVATGFGKTGKMFAVELGNITPDVLILGKGLSGGYLPISAAVTTEEIFQGFLGNPEEKKTFFYGQTFAGNPLAAAAAKANLELFESQPVLANVEKRIPHFHAQLRQRVSPLSHVDEVRTLGLMAGIEFTREKGKHVPYSPQELAGQKVVNEARKRGVFIRPLGNVMILMPALAMTEHDLTRLVDVTAQAIEAALGK